MAGDRRAFGTSHPAVLLTYFLGALVLCIAAQQPLFQAVGLGAAAAYYLDLQGRAAAPMRRQPALPCRSR